MIHIMNKQAEARRLCSVLGLPQQLANGAVYMYYNIEVLVSDGSYIIRKIEKASLSDAIDYIIETEPTEIGRMLVHPAKQFGQRPFDLENARG